MKPFLKVRKFFSLSLIATFLIAISLSNANANTVGSFSQNKYQINKSSENTTASANALLAAVAFGVGFVAGLGSGLIAGWAAAGELVDALGQELASSFDDINYNKSDLSEFDPA